MCLYPGSLHITPLSPPLPIYYMWLVAWAIAISHVHSMAQRSSSPPTDSESLCSCRVPGHNCGQQPSQYTLLTSKVCLPDFQV